MSGSPIKNFNLPWHQHERYWVCLFPNDGPFLPAAVEAMKTLGMQELPGNGMGMHAPRNWKSQWDSVYTALKSLGDLATFDAMVTPGQERPHGRIESECKTMQAMQQIAESLWMGEALLENRIMCYLQPVVSDKDKIFGYESFARVKASDGKIIGGDAIINASKILGIEYMIDRHLHIQAIKTFVSSAFDGFLFVNFFPGFIHRPAVYLEGLSETAKSFGVISKHIVLDFTKSETPHDLIHLKSVCDYGRTQGYSIALDDISSIDGARKLIGVIRPDFVKIDMHLVREALNPVEAATIRSIAELTHAVGGTVIAEGVETDDIYNALRPLGVDLFQGYLFSPPVPVEAAFKRGTGTV
jgi:EAL domain-containing protein (putative c-di-GMP-specific phosphodiesterase class I)